MLARLVKSDDPLGPPPNTPKEVLVALVELNEWYHGLFEPAMNAVQFALEELRERRVRLSALDL